jgi:hypothetical protein
MALNNIEQLLDKYFEGETSIAEEEVLKDYFNSENVAPHLEIHKPLFSYFSLAKDDVLNKTTALQTKKRYSKVGIGIAASLLFAVGIVTFWDKPSEKKEDLGSFEDPEIAFKETQKALAMLSENVNVGIQSLEYINEYEKSKKIIFK